MEITLNRDTQTLEIRVPADQVSDELLGVLPEATTTAEGCLAWSIRFGDITRAPRASSSNTLKDELLGFFETPTVEDEWIGAVETWVEEISSATSRTSPSEPASVIRGTLILTFTNSPITAELTPSIGRPIPIFADNIAISDFDFVSSSSARLSSGSFGILPNPPEASVLLFANPFSA